METIYILLLLYIFCALPHGVNSWFFGATGVDEEDDVDLDRSADRLTSVDVRSTPFEIATADDKFLLEAVIAKDLSILDACYHRVVSELEGRCSDLSEEELSKLSVGLFNCQAAVEKRQTYSCTSDMAIADCTRDMDSTTWNAYQIVSNRARSVCYGVRQQHFRARAELTVNRLMESSEQQLSRLATISQTQEQLKDMADSTIERLETGRRQIESDQQQIKQANRIMNSEVLRNLRDIQLKKEVIIAGNEQLIAKTEQIQQKLDSTSEQIAEQAEVQSVRHKELLGDLAELGTQAEAVSSKLEESTMVVENFRLNAIEYQLDAIENLKNINDTVNFLLSLLNNAREVLEAKLEWILLVTGATDSRMTIISVLAIHFLYAVVAVISFSILRVTKGIRYLLVTVILLNATAELQFNSGFEFTTLAAALVAVGLIGSFIAWCLAFLFRHSPSAKPVANSKSCDNANYRHSLSNEDIKYVIRSLEQLSADFTRRISVSDKHEPVGNVTMSCSTPIRHLPEVGHESLSKNKHAAGLPLDCSPPPVRRHLLPITPPNPPPTPFTNERPLMNNSGVLKLDSSNVSCPGSPAGSFSCSGTPVRGYQKKRRASSMNRSFVRALCTAVTKSGQACKLPSQEGSVLCYHHRHN